MSRENLKQGLIAYARSRLQYAPRLADYIDRLEFIDMWDWRDLEGYAPLLVLAQGYGKTPAHPSTENLANIEKAIQHVDKSWNNKPKVSLKGRLVSPEGHQSRSAIVELMIAGRLIEILGEDKVKLNETVSSSPSTDIDLELPQGKIGLEITSAHVAAAGRQGDEVAHSLERSLEADTPREGYMKIVFDPGYL